MSNITPDDLADHMDECKELNQVIEDLDLFNQFSLPVLASVFTSFSVIPAKIGGIKLPEFLKMCEAKFNECQVMKIEIEDDDK